jgi:dephospho-CoA kinase
VPPVVGLTGGIGAGKSEALEAFRRHGAATLSSDDVVRGLYERPDVVAAVAELFGPTVVAAGGGIDRTAVAALVFEDEHRRRDLEALLLPLVQREFERWRDQQTAAGAALLVHEAPTLFEAGVADRYDAIVTVTAPVELREQRRPGSAQRMAAQLPEQEKARRSDVVYVNTGSLDDLDSFVGEVVERLAGR